LLLCAFAFADAAQTSNAEPHQASPALAQNSEIPDPSASAADLESRGDLLRVQKMYLDALDYYRAALLKNHNSAPLLNKMGIAELLLQHWSEAKKDFDRAIKLDNSYADAYNNLGVIFYLSKKYGKAVDRYEHAIKLRPASASYYSNMGAAYFSKKDFQRSIVAYAKALELDPDVFERSSHGGVAAQMAKPEDRARYDFEVAKLYAKMGVSDRSLQYLRRAMEEGYKNIDSVYKDDEFAGIRKDPRFTELMGARPPAIPE
jgi:tetratricopeptide (TPR) repeat protein